MSSVPAGIAAQQAMLQQTIAISLIKQSAQADRAIATILEQAITNVPTGGRGGSVNLSA